MSSYLCSESEGTYAEAKREEAGDTENRPGFHSGQTGVWEQGQHQEARGRSRTVPVIRENGWEGEKGSQLRFTSKVQRYRKFTQICFFTTKSVKGMHLMEQGERTVRRK